MMRITCNKRKTRKNNDQHFTKLKNPYTLQQNKQAIQLQNHFVEPNVKFPEQNVALLSLLLWRQKGILLASH